MRTQRPNALLLMAANMSWANGTNQGRVMGTRTPNIDRVAGQGALMTNDYPWAACTAGRMASTTGQIEARTGLTAVGMPGVYFVLGRVLHVGRSTAERATCGVCPPVAA
jgi:arylsulfatase A-like enzyme